MIHATIFIVISLVLFSFTELQDVIHNKWRYASFFYFISALDNRLLGLHVLFHQIISQESYLFNQNSNRAVNRMY